MGGILNKLAIHVQAIARAVYLSSHVNDAKVDLM
jgi:hypothetical protein